MEWFRRPDGSVAVSEVGARPPGAQLSSMLGYVHDVDFYRVWTELVILDRFDPPERRFAAGTAYLRGQGRGRVRAVHGVDELQRQLGHLVVEAQAARAGAAGVVELRGRGLRDRPRIPRPRSCATRCGGSSRASGSSWWRSSDSDTVVMLSPGFPAEMAYFTRALAAVGARVIGVGDQPPPSCPPPARDALAHYEHVALADEGAVLAALRGLARHARFDQVECLWEPYMILAARIREAFGLPGHDRRADASRSGTRSG